MKTLKLASPLLSGDPVKHAQRVLAGENKFKQNYAPGKVDGVFGESTARAAKRAKFWVGYPPEGIKGSYGDTLNAYLTGTKKLPPAYAKRRTARLRARPKVKLREKALKRAITQLGTEESPAGSNEQKYGEWYRWNGVSWCAIFATWCYVLSGSKGMKQGVRYAYVPYIVIDGRKGVNGLAITSHPQPGDLVCYDWDGDGVADHVGLYEKDLPGAAFSAIEGNTAVGNDSNGGKVMRRERKLSQVKAFVHVAL